MAELLFYVLSLGAIGFGVSVIAAKSPMFSVLSLLGSFVCLAGIYLLAGFQFLAAAQLLVYAGAIMVLFLFVVMLLNLGEGDPDSAVEPHPGRALGSKRLFAAAASTGALAVAGILAAGAAPVHAALDPELASSGFDALDAVAAVLFSKYALVFQAAGLLLLVTMVAVVVLAKRQRPVPIDWPSGRPSVEPNRDRAGATELSLGDPVP